MNEESIFARALELSDEQREAYLSNACDGDSKLLERVHALLDAHDNPDSLFQEQQPVATVDYAPVKERVGTTIGPYRLMEQIGEGGFGIVYVAEQQRPVKRKVALKIIKPGMDTKDVIARFEAERQALALMDHPNIARVLDAGATDSGRPYFVMELVRGIPFTEYCQKHRVPTPERLELFATVCRAIQHAHQKGIIHRDVKPSNVLIALHDGNPVPKIIDFGIAKAINQQLTEHTIYTRFEQIIGTPLYMSPEQAELSNLDIDTRTDVYSLGVLLYELLTGTTPFDEQRMKAAAYDEIRRIIREEDPPKPSTRISTLANSETDGERHKSDADKLSQLMRGELDWIVMKALEKDRTRRYETASSFADDVCRFLGGEPVEACPPSHVYQIRKFIRRHRRPVIAAALLMTVLSAGIVSTSIGLLAALESQRIADGERVKANKMERKARDEAQRTQWQLYISDVNSAYEAWEHNALGSMRNLLDRHRNSPFRKWEWYYLDRLWSTAQSHPLARDTDALRLVISPRGDRILATSSGPHAMDALSGQLEFDDRIGDLGTGFHFPYASFTPDGTRFVHANNDYSALTVRDSETLDPIRDILPPDELEDVFISDAKYSPDGSWLAVAIAGKGVALYDPKLNRWADPIIPLEGIREGVEHLEFSQDESLLAVSSDPLAVLNVETGQVRRLPGHRKGVSCVRFANNGDWLMSAGFDRRIIVWEVSTGRKVEVFETFDAQVRQLAYDAKNQRLAAGLRNRTIRTWSFPDFTELATLRTYNGMYALDFRADGRLVYGNLGGGISEHEDVSIRQSRTIRDLGTVHDVAFSFNGEIVVSLSRRGTDPSVHAFDMASRIPSERPLPELPFEVNAIALGRHSNLLACANGNAAQIAVIDLDRNTVKWTEKSAPGSGILTLAFDDQDKVVRSGHTDGRVIAWDLEKQTSKVMSDKHDGKVREIMAFGDGRRWASGGRDGSVFIWNDDKVVESEHGVQGGAVRGFDIEGDALVFGLFRAPQGSARVFIVENGERRDVPNAHVFTTQDVALLGDGETLVSMGADRQIRLWDRENLELRFTLRVPEIFETMDVSPNGTMIAAGTREGSIFFYDGSELRR